MEYRGIWIVFYAFLVLLGGSVAFNPAAVARLLQPKGDLPSMKFLKMWRLLGVFVAIVSLVELVAVVGGGKLLR